MGRLTRYHRDGDQLWTEVSPGVADTAEENDSFSWAVAAGDFDDDGFRDLLVGVEFEDQVAVDAGGVHVIYGVSGGLTGTDSLYLRQYDVNVLDTAETPRPQAASNPGPPDEKLHRRSIGNIHHQASTADTNR